PAAIAAGDIDGDGRADFVVAHAGRDDLAVVLSRANGSFEEVGSVPVGIGPAALQLVDVNRDGWADVIAASGIANSVGVLLGRGDGTFAAAREWPTRPPP